MIERIHIGVVDDDPLAGKLVELYLKDIASEIKVSTYYTRKDWILHMETGIDLPQILLLDVNLADDFAWNVLDDMQRLPNYDKMDLDIHAFSANKTEDDRSKMSCSKLCGYHNKMDMNTEFLLDLIRLYKFQRTSVAELSPVFLVSTSAESITSFQQVLKLIDFPRALCVFKTYTIAYEYFLIMESAPELIIIDSGVGTIECDRFIAKLKFSFKDNPPKIIQGAGTVIDLKGSELNELNQRVHGVLGSALPK